MIAETANLASGHNVVKRALLCEASAIAQTDSLRYQARNAAPLADHQKNMRTVCYSIRREQTSYRGCLTKRLSGKPCRTMLCKLPAKGRAE
jgi:hypothetical protein